MNALQLDRQPLTGKPFANCLEMRNVKNKGFQSFGARNTNVAFIRYEDARGRPEQVVDELSGAFDLVRKHQFLPVKHTVSPRFLEGHIAPSFKDFTTEDIDHINKNLNWRTERMFGYCRVEHKQFRSTTAA